MRKEMFRRLRRQNTEDKGTITCAASHANLASLCMELAKLVTLSILLQTP